MPFTKGDPNINRAGRPRNAEIQQLRDALFKEGEKRGECFWAKVAHTAYTNPTIMAAVIKKFVPDKVKTEIEGSLNITTMPTIKIDDKQLEIDIGQNRVAQYAFDSGEAPTDNLRS